jgi:hypothetical protein
VHEPALDLKPGEAPLSVIPYGEHVYGAENSQFREQARRQLAEPAGLFPVMEISSRADDFYGLTHWQPRAA